MRLRMRNRGMVALFATACLAAGVIAAPIAAADDNCDPTASICESPGNVQINDAPPVSATDDQYPFDGEWYFNPGGGGTELQPEHPSGGGGSAGGGGGHR